MVNGSLKTLVTTVLAEIVTGRPDVGDNNDEVRQIVILSICNHGSSRLHTRSEGRRGSDWLHFLCSSLLHFTTSSDIKDASFCLCFRANPFRHPGTPFSTSFIFADFQFPVLHTKLRILGVPTMFALPLISAGLLLSLLIAVVVEAYQTAKSTDIFHGSAPAPSRGMACSRLGF